MATEFKLSYTANDINIRLGKIDSLAEKTELPTKTSDLTNDSGFVTESYVQEYAQPIGDYALKSEISEVPVQSVNGQTGDVNLSASDVGALPDTTEIPTVPTNVSAFTNDAGYLTEHQSLDGLATEDYVDAQISAIPTPDVSGQIETHNASTSAHSDIRSSIEELENTVNGIAVPTKLSDLADDSTHRVVADTEKSTWNAKAEVSDIPTKVSELTNDSGYITGYTETDPTVPAWAKAESKPTYTASEVGAVSYTEQTLTDEQKAQARENIGAISENEKVYTSIETDIVSGKLVAGPGIGQWYWENAAAQYCTADVSGFDKVSVSGYQWVEQYQYYSCWFLDESGALISKHVLVSDNNIFTNVEIDVPEKAKTIGVNGHISLPISVIGVNILSVLEILAENIPTKKIPKLITLGDSITQLTGERGWVTYFQEVSGCELIANTAVIGAHLKDKSGTVYDGEPVFNGDDSNVNNVLGNQVQKIINANYEAPDIIIIAIGTNDGINITKEQINNVYYDSNNDLIPLDSVDRTTAAGAYRYCLEKLHELYPNAVICWSTPIMAYQKTRSPLSVVDWAESLRIATEFTGQIYIDTLRCGINSANEVSDANGENLADGLHPNSNGAKKIGYYMASKVKPFIDCNFINS